MYDIPFGEMVVIVLWVRANAGRNQRALPSKTLVDQLGALTGSQFYGIGVQNSLQKSGAMNNNLLK